MGDYFQAKLREVDVAENKVADLLKSLYQKEDARKFTSPHPSKPNNSILIST